MKRLLALLCSLALVFCLLPSTAFAEGGNGNIDGGGGSMGQGTSSNFWNPGNDGVRITVVDADSGTAISSPVDFSNRVQKNSVLHFGKVNKLQYLGGTALSLQSGVAYSCIKPAQSMPTIVSSKGQSNIEAIKRYFCSEYACQMVAQAAGVDYERMIAGDYKLLIEPIAYFTHNGQYYCMTATEAALYDQKSGGALRKTMTSLTHKNLPLSMFLEFSDLGLPAWTGSTTSKQSNADIISSLGVGIVWFDERPPEGEIEAPDVEYRVDTDVITSVTLRTDTDLTPDNPASVTFHILGTTYRVNDIVIPAGDSQVVWVKWHTPSTPQSVTITVSVSGAYTAQDTFVAEIVDLNEHIPPDPTATDTNPNYTVPSLPNEPQKLTANWGVWSCYWVPVWVWCDHDDWGHWVDEGYWEYEYTGYSASISGVMSLMPDDIVPTASGKSMKSGYGVKQPIITKKPSTKRVRGALPPLAENSPLNRAMPKLPSTRPMISGRIYCTAAARCRPRPPAVSRRKQAMQKPMFVGLPSAVKMSAARPTAAPAIMTPRCTFFIFSNSPFLIVDKINTFCRKPVYRFIF